ncbi:MAG TPA: hypothetical protein VD861_05745 [Pyrinomonadaceae bacterium]|nr:hypothetical protein [Pyrinomonadaceae bacterium]
MRQVAKRISRETSITRLILVACSLIVFNAPGALADSGPDNPRARSSAHHPYDLTPHGWRAENLLREIPKSGLGATPASPATLKAAAEPLAPAQSACAPYRYCLFAGCWYELLNNSTFDEPGCSPDWVFPAGYNPPSTTLCNNMPYPVYSKAVVLPTASGFYQDFYVPADAFKPLEASIQFITLRTPTSPSDRIILELRENGVLLEQKTISTYLGPFDCHQENFTFSQSYAGRNLRLRVRSVHVTPGVQYYVDSVFVSSNLIP